MKKLIPIGLTLGLLASPLVSQANTLLGVYYGNQGWAMPEVVELEQWQEKKHSVVTLFTGWSENSKYLLFNHQLDKVWNHGSIPMITWEPWFGEGTPDNIETLIAQGEYDEYIASWADNLKNFIAGDDQQLGTEDDKRAYIRLAHEANGNWYPWSAQQGVNTPDDFTSMWKHVWNLVAQTGLNQDHIQWVWTVNASDAGSFTAEDYYPGEQYVDWVGIDGYNWGNDYSWSTWRTPEAVFADMLQRLRVIAPNKPVSLPEVGSTSNKAGVTDLAAKDEWISQLFSYLHTADIRMISWFNEDKEADWQMFDGRNGPALWNDKFVYPAYKTEVQNSALIGADPLVPSILSTEQFQGQFDNNTPVKKRKKQRCKVKFKVTESWNGGYVAKVKVKANYPVGETWNLVWEHANDTQINHGWNGAFEQTNKTVSVDAPTWWKWMPSTKKPKLGYVGLGTPEKPVSASLNGQSCKVKFVVK